MIRKLNFEFANPKDPAQINRETHENVAGVQVEPKSALYDFTRLQEPLNPTIEVERYLQATGDFMPIHKQGLPTDTERLFFDFNFWLEHNRKYDPDFVTAKLIPLEGYVNKAIRIIWKLRQQYDDVAFNGQFKSTLPYLYRFRTLYWWMWYTLLTLNVELTSDFEHFTEMMECACCSLQLENVSFCIQVLGGQWAEDRESLLAKLRPYFQQHLARVKSKVITCDCGKGIN